LGAARIDEQIDRCVRICCGHGRCHWCGFGQGETFAVHSSSHHPRDTGTEEALSGAATRARPAAFVALRSASFSSSATESPKMPRLCMGWCQSDDVHAPAAEVVFEVGAMLTLPLPEEGFNVGDIGSAGDVLDAFVED